MIRWRNGATIKQSEMSSLGFRSLVIYRHMLKAETTYIEVGGREGGCEK